MVLLSKIEEVLSVDGQSYELSVNRIPARSIRRANCI